MNILSRIAELIDSLNDRIGRAVAWLALVMVLIGSYNAIVRYLGRYIEWNLSSNFYLELQWYLFSLLFLIGGAFTLKEDAHVRVDVIYSNLSERLQHWIDIVGTVIFLIPFSVVCLYFSWPSVRNSWAIGEGSSDPGGLPRYPLKAMILVCFALLILQGVAEIVKRVKALRSSSDDGTSAES